MIPYLKHLSFSLFLFLLILVAAPLLVVLVGAFFLFMHISSGKMEEES